MQKIIGMLSLLILGLSLFGCSAPGNEMQVQEQSTTAIFTSPQYSFSFTYPTGWQQVTADLPNKWAIKDANNDAILFTVNKAPVENLALLGNIQAIRDLYQIENQSGLTEDKMDAISKIVKIEKFENAEFYTYAIDFADKRVQSIVSGTVCDGNEVTIVLVASSEASQEKTDLYRDILDSFSCSS